MSNARYSKRFETAYKNLKLIDYLLINQMDDNNYFIDDAAATIT